MLYPIYRNETVVAEVYPEGQREKEIMSKNIVSFSFKSPVSIEFAIGDTVTVWGETYYLNQLDELTKDSSLNFRYRLLFQADHYSLAKPKLFGYDSLNALKLLRFEIMVNAEMLLDLIIANANRTQSGWIKGDCIDSGFKLLAFNGESVLQAIDIAAKEFETEWWIENKFIHLLKRGSVSGYKFSYGYNKGLRGGLERVNVDTSSVFSRLYVTGSDQNLPPDYRNGQKNLLLPDGMDYIQGPLYGKDEIESFIEFPEVRPERNGTVTSTIDPFVFKDADLDFDINAQLYPGLSAKISFTTGQLAGYVFEIAKGGVNFQNKTITIIKNEQEKGLEVPSAYLRPGVGDKYVILDIIMPLSYVENAQDRLLEKGQEHFNKQSVPRVAYNLPPDNFFFKRNNIRLNLGDYVEMSDVDLRLDKSIRIYSFEQDLHNEFKYNALKISDLPIGSAYIRQVAAEEKLQKNLQLNKISDISRARLNWKTSQEQLNQYFDPSSKQIFTEAISPVTLRALMIQTGDASQQLVLDGINFKSNYLGDVNKIAWTGGRLIHATIEANPKAWEINGGVVSELDPAKPYYIYAKCETQTDQGSIVISDVQYTVDGTPGYYHFWIGFANSVVDNFRVLKSVYGTVSIYGRTIEGGIIVGNELEINLDEGSITGKVNFSSGSTGYDNIEDKPDLSEFFKDGDLGEMAFEDAVELAKLGTSIVQGGYIKADLIDVLLLIARNLRTANVGEKRVSINGVNNNIQIISADNTVLIEADDDSAIDSFTGATPNYGPGLRVGPINGDNSTLSGKLIRVYKSGNNKQSYIAPEAIYSDGFMNIWGAYVNLLGNFRVTPTSVSFDNVDIYADGAQGYTGYELVSSSGPQTRKYVRGIYIGIGPNDHW